MALKTFSEHCNSGLFTPEFHPLDHGLEELRVFWSLYVFDASLSERHHVNVKQTYKQTLKRIDACTNENVGKVKRQLERFITHSS